MFEKFCKYRMMNMYKFMSKIIHDNRIGELWNKYYISIIVKFCQYYIYDRLIYYD